jgi:tetratricopeptide (TPR) repeat protein
MIANSQIASNLYKPLSNLVGRFCLSFTLSISLSLSLVTTQLALAMPEPDEFFKTLEKVNQLHEASEYKEAEKRLLDLEAQVDEAKDANNPLRRFAIANLYGALGNVYTSQDKLELAESYLNKAIGYFEQGLPDTLLHLAGAQNDLAFLKMRNGDLDKSAALYLKALPVLEKLNAPQLPITLNNFAEVLRHQKKYPEALQYYEKAIAIHQKNGNEKSMAHPISNMVQVYWAMGDMAKTEEYLFKGYQLIQKYYPEDHLVPARQATVLGNFYIAKKNYGDAEKYLRKALAVEIQKLPSTHTDLATTKYFLGRSLLERETPTPLQKQEGLQNLKEAKQICSVDENKTIDNCPNILTQLNKLAVPSLQP